MASTNSESAQKSFNPSWMQSSSLRMPKQPNGTHRAAQQPQQQPPQQQQDEEDSASLEMMDPIFAKYRYGREDILALMRKDTKPPDGLAQCPFYIEKPLTPIILTNLSETEQRLQQNINSSKALSAAHRGEWQGKEDSPNSPQANPWTIAGGSRAGSSFRTSNNRWTAPSSGEGGGRGGKTFAGFGRPGFGGQATHNGEKPRSKNPWTEVGSGFKSRQHMKSSGEEAAPPPQRDDSEAGAWRMSAERNQSSEKPKNVEPIGSARERAGHRAASDESAKEQHMSQENVWSSALHGNAVWTPTTMSETVSSNVTEKPDFAQSTQSAFERQQFEPESAATRSKISPTQTRPPEPQDSKPDQWFYLDPQGVQRGPFSTAQMHAWFENGYFQPDLRIMQPGDDFYTPLGELIKSNGALTPFNVKSRGSRQSPGATASSTAASSNVSVAGNVNPWSNTSATATRQEAVPTSNYSTNPNADLSLESLKILEVKQRMIAEEERKLREKQELLQREEQERKERERQMKELADKLERQRLEFEQRAREQEQELEMRRLQILEYEKRKKEQLEQLEAQKEQERQRILMEAELIRRKEEELRRAKEEAEMRQEYERQQELQRKEAERRLREETERRLLEEKRLREEHEARMRQEAELKRQQQAAILARQQQERQQQEQAAQLARQQQEQAALLAAQKQQQKPVAPPKAAPWVTASGKHANTAPEFREILEQERIETLRKRQEEEEERRRQEAAQKKAAAAQNNGNPWNVTKSTAKPAPIIPPPSKEQPTKKQGNKPTAKTQQQPVTEKKEEDPLTAWVVQRIKQMNSGIDTDVFATFLLGIESPNEVEDYITTYFGETKRARDFHQEFLAKRIELRPKKAQAKEDDLSGPAAAIVTDKVAAPGTSANAAKSKKSKKGKKVDVTLGLSFKPGADPNRFNAGEIDNTPPAPVKKGKKK